MRETFVALFFGALFLSACGDAPPPVEPETKGLETKVLTAETVNSSEEDWGTFAEYFAGETQGLSNLLSGTATIKPGMQIHPPHRHAEEEFLMVLEGEGEWTVGDKTFKATKGDMLYAAAWDLHGIENTGEAPLSFVFWKAHPKGMPLPADPDQ